MALRKIILMLLVSLALSPSVALASEISEREAIKRAKAKYSVKVQLVGDVQSFEASGKKYFKIKLLLVDKGRRKTVYVERSSGKVLDRKP